VVLNKGFYYESIPLFLIMKKILPLIALVILFATACKKDKNEPEPTPNPTLSSFQSLDEKEFEINEYWSRDSFRRDRFIIENASSTSANDSLLKPRVGIDIYDSLKSNTNRVKYKINIVGSDSIQLSVISGNANFSLGYKLTSLNYQGSYFVFSASVFGPSFSLNATDSIVPKNFIDFVNGTHSNLNNLSLSSAVGLHNETLLFVPTGSVGDVFFLKENDTGGGFFIEQLNSTTINRYGVPNYFSAGYDEIQLTEIYERVYYSKGVLK